MLLTFPIFSLRRFQMFTFKTTSREIIFKYCSNKAARKTFLSNSVSKVVCVARNYSENEGDRSLSIERRSNDAAIFIKPPNSIASISPKISIYGYNDVICETELALSIHRSLPRTLSDLADSTIYESIGGLGIAFDLTRKDLQNQLKQQGKPWELSKGFDGACPVSPFIQFRDFDRLDCQRVQLTRNGVIELDEPIGHMILPIPDLIRTITKHMSLWPGDIVLTGTPTLPNPPPRLVVGDTLRAKIGDILEVNAVVV